MTTALLLRIDSSARRDGSHSRALADHAVDRWRRVHPDGRVIVRDLAATPLPHLTDETIRGFATPSGRVPAAAPGLAWSDELIGELEGATHVLISTPVYNFNVPSVLKAYFDHVIRSGRTFVYDNGNYTGRLRGKVAWVITARGGDSARAPHEDLPGTFLATALRFIGFESVRQADAGGLAASPEVRAQSLEAARRRIDRWFEPATEVPGAEPDWVGDFDAEDRRQISALRQGQARAIEAGDAEAYAALCTEDVHLMVPGHDVVMGRDELLALERRLFRATRFPPLRKQPLRVERSGDLAIEIGRQELELAPGETGAGIAARKQKYTHVFRRTPAGWRFAVLMSNVAA